MNCKLICDYCKNKNRSRHELQNHKKNFIINSEPRCSLYDKCHIKTEYDMNYKFICDYYTNKSRSRQEFMNHKKNFIINLEPRCSLYDKGHIKTEYDMNSKFICDYCTNENHLSALWALVGVVPVSSIRETNQATWTPVHTDIMKPQCYWSAPCCADNLINCPDVSYSRLSCCTRASGKWISNMELGSWL